MGTIGIILLIIAIIGGIIAFSSQSSNNNDSIVFTDEQLSTMSEREKEAAQYQESYLTEINAQFGEISRILLSPQKADVYSIQEGFFVILLESARKIIVNRAILDYTDILAYEVVENNVVKYCEVINTTETKTQTGSLIGRALIGGVLLGGIGAVAGGLTAKQSSVATSYQPSSNFKYNYLVLRIVIKGISSQTLIIEDDGNLELSEKLYANLYPNTTYSETWNRYVLDVKDILSKIIQENNSAEISIALNSSI